MSDVRAGSVFVLDAAGGVIGALQGIDRPLGLAVDAAGAIYVGSQGARRVEVFSPAGDRRQIIGAGRLRMPTDLEIDAAGTLYVADSLADRVWIFDRQGELAGALGGRGSAPGQLRFPTAVCFDDDRGELYVADQGNYRVQVFDRQGRHRRTLAGPAEAFGGEWRGRLVKVQALDLDPAGHLHVLDSALHRVQVLDPISGAYLADYGRLGSGPGGLALPLDLLLDGGVAIVANAERGRVERLRLPTQAAE